MSKLRDVIFFFIFLVITASPLHAQLPEVSGGVGYLASIQSAEGTWGADSSTVDTTTTTISVLETLKLLNQTSGSAYLAGSSWLQGQSFQGIDPVAGRIRALSFTDVSAETLITAFDKFKGAWGGDDEYEPNNIDTSFALQALKTVNYPDEAIISSALTFLTSTQNPDGGWGFAFGDDSSVYSTALVSMTIQKFPQTISLASALYKATEFLLAQQNVDGGFGRPVSNAHETALAYTALVAVSTDATVLGKAVGCLSSTQSADGSWNNDPYSTALALQAFYYSEKKPALPTPPTTGTVIGKVISAVGGEALAGVAISLSGGPELATIADESGAFKLVDVPQGSQHLFLSLSGFTTSTATATVTAGTIANLGTFTLAATSTTGIIQGIVTDATTHLPLNGVVISVVGGGIWTVVTAADGSFRIESVIPGAVTLTATMEGYPSLTGIGEVTVGGILVFSPALSTSPSATLAGGLRGRVVDAASDLPIAGATVTLTKAESRYTSTTTADGIFSMPDIEPGNYLINFKAFGYYDQTGSLLLNISAGSVTNWDAKLNIAPTTTTISGKVTESTTGIPIVDAVVSVVGTDLTTKTDASGLYTMEGVNALEFKVKASALGYDTLEYPILSPYHDFLLVDFSLNPSRTGNVGIVSFKADKENYEAYSDVAITTELLNTDALPSTVLVGLSILTSQGEVVYDHEVTAPDDNGVSGGELTFPSGIIRPVTTVWNTGQLPPGTYRVIVKIMELPSITGTGSTVVAQRSLNIVIEPTKAVASLVLTPLPRFTNLGAVEQIYLQASIVNRSNVPVEVAFTYEWKNPTGNVVHTGIGTVSVQPSEGAKAVLVDSFPFTFSESGGYPVEAVIIKGPMPINLVGGALSVAPGIRIEPIQSVTPRVVAPNGNTRIKLNIRLKGVESR